MRLFLLLPRYLGLEYAASVFFFIPAVPWILLVDCLLCGLDEFRLKFPRLATCVELFYKFYAKVIY